MGEDIGMEVKYCYIERVTWRAGVLIREWTVDVGIVFFSEGMECCRGDGALDRLSIMFVIGFKNHYMITASNLARHYVLYITWNVIWKIDGIHSTYKILTRRNVVSQLVCDLSYTFRLLPNLYTVHIVSTHSNQAPILYIRAQGNFNLLPTRATYKVLYTSGALEIYCCFGYGMV